MHTGFEIIYLLGNDTEEQCCPLKRGNTKEEQKLVKGFLELSLEKTKFTIYSLKRESEIPSHFGNLWNFSVHSIVFFVIL